PVAEFDLRDISYHVCGPASHELQLPPLGTAGSPGPSGTEGTVVALRFLEEREAQQWWTVLSSSLREARRGGDTWGHDWGQGDTGTGLGT
ncbi:HOIL1 protein, partial [Sterrhoptilus dennistouni]|nr:HOIL1 protein [Sterrhoptilus dennistouni]